MNKADYSLYAVMGSDFIPPAEFKKFIREIIPFVTIVQLREKNIPAAVFVKYALEIKKILKPQNIPLIINDRIDVAYEAGADGVHLGQNDIGVHTAGKILGEEAIIGLSIDKVTQVRQALESPLDYISVSPVFDTKSKRDISKPLGLKGLKQIKAIAKKIPVVAIGGINLNNAKSVFKAGADGICVISAICGAKNPALAAKKLREVSSRV